MTNGVSCEFVRLNEKILLQYMKKIMDIETLCFSHMKLWSEKNFLMKLDNKWDLSFIIYCGDEMGGFVIGSRYNETGHVHRIAIHPRFRQKGLGTELISYFVERCKELGIGAITLEFEERQHISAFYKDLGFVALSYEETMQYLKKKDKLAAKETYKIINENGYRYVYSKEILGRGKTVGCSGVNENGGY
jgi:ribosomal-protein-alanine N-acetyltransferase